MIGYAPFPIHQLPLENLIQIPGYKSCTGLVRILNGTAMVLWSWGLDWIWFYFLLSVSKEKIQILQCTLYSNKEIMK